MKHKNAKKNYDTYNLERLSFADIVICPLMLFT